MLTTLFGLPEQCELLFLDIISPDIFVFELHYRQSPHAFPVTTKTLVHMGITGDYKNNLVVIKIFWCPCEQLLPHAVGSVVWWHMDKEQVILWGLFRFSQQVINLGCDPLSWEGLLGPVHGPNPATPRGLFQGL